MKIIQKRTENYAYLVRVPLNITQGFEYWQILKACSIQDIVIVATFGNSGTYYCNATWYEK